MWVQNAPTEPGHYWVWQDAETWPCKGVVHCVLVEQAVGCMVAWVPFMDFSDATTCSTWANAFWFGPVPPPEAPSRR
jgi:hypothetical protein